MLLNPTVNSFTEAVFFLSKQKKSQVLRPFYYCNAVCSTTKAENPQDPTYQWQLRRSLHVTKVNRDLEAGLRALGCGMATTGMIGSGFGIGIIFGSQQVALARNPSLTTLLQGMGIVGAALCESIALFCFVVIMLIK